MCLCVSVVCVCLCVSVCVCACVRGWVGVCVRGWVEARTALRNPVRGLEDAIDVLSCNADTSVGSSGVFVEGSVQGLQVKRVLPHAAAYTFKQGFLCCATSRLSTVYRANARPLPVSSISVHTTCSSSLKPHEITMEPSCVNLPR